MLVNQNKQSFSFQLGINVSQMEVYLDFGHRPLNYIITDVPEIA